MKWTISGSNSLDEVLAFWANERDVYALKELENHQYRFSKTSGWQPGDHTLGDFRQIEPLKALFFPANGLDTLNRLSVTRQSTFCMQTAW